MTEALAREERTLREKVAELTRTTEELSRTQQELVRTERLAGVGRLSAGLAHEIGNPLAALMGMQDLLLSGELSGEESRDFMERMRRETERMHRIVQDLLQFARPEQKTSLHPSPVQAAHAARPKTLVTEVLDELGALLGAMPAFRDVQLTLDPSPPTLAVRMDRDALLQVLLNLCLNAADAVHAPGAHARTVAVRVSTDDTSHADIAVEDGGPGVAPRVRDRLFEPFVTTKDVGKGTGLGLAVCRGLVDATGGSLQLDGGFTSGARFVVRVPTA
jgi:signal transduction histidine kinase